MQIADITDIRDTPEIAVIINVGTRYVSTLALLSTLRYVRVPTVMLDCESTDGSYEWFKRLMKDYDFHLMSAPLRQHGETLDRIFQRTQAERVLLVDSDAEALNDAMITDMRMMLDSSPRVYGSGYLHPAHWLEHHYWTDWPIAKGIGYYMERPWIPFTLLRVNPIRDALSHGRSFMHRLVRNELPQIPWLSRGLWARFRFRFFRRHRLSFLDVFRRNYDGAKPSYISYDTGADIHEYLTRKKGYSFEGVSAEFVPWSVTHFSGITRSTLHEGATSDAFRLIDAHPVIIDRLKSLYGIDLQSA